MDKFIAMRVFQAVAEAASFAGAARELGMSRSQVNRLVIQLEDALSVSLFNRTTRKVQLSAPGRLYLAKVERILAEVHEAECLLKEEHGVPKGEINVNAPMSFGTLYLGEILADFLQRYPDIRVRLSLSDAQLDPMTQGFDLTLRIAEPLAEASLIGHEIASISRVLCASPAYLQSQQAVLSPAELKHHSCLHYGHLPSGNRWKLVGPGGETQVVVKGRYCSNNGEVLCQAALAGLGIVFLPGFIVGPYLRAGRLVRVLPDYYGTALSLQVLYAPNRHMSERIRIFVKYIQSVFAESMPSAFEI